MRHLPWMLVWLRLMLAPLLLALALWAPSRAGFALCLSLALLSDYLDGVLARHWGTATVNLRRFDSAADSAFWLAALAAVWMLYPNVLHRASAPLLVLFALELARYVLDWLKFGREASYHMWSAKIWALSLFAGFFVLLVVQRDDALVTVAITVGIVSDLEGLFISLLLPAWRCDVPSVFHAWRLRSL